MFPISDSPNPKGTAWVNLALIAINVAVFALLAPQMARPADPGDPRYSAYVAALQREGGIPPAELEAAMQQLSEYDLTVYEYGSRPADPSFVDMLTSMFMHGGLMHLFGNMLFLWIYGNNVEFRLGRILYLLAYLFTGFVAAWGDTLLRPDSNIPAVGASGAISGVLGMYFIWFPHNRVRMLVFLPPFVMQQVELGARLVLGFYIVANNLLPVLLSGAGGGGGVAYGAHIAGFAAGLVLALIGSAIFRLWPGKAGAEGETIPTREVLKQAGPTAVDALSTADSLARAGDARGALLAYRRALAMKPPPEDAARAHLGAARVLLQQEHQPAAAYQHIYAALAAGATEDQAHEAEQLLRQMKGMVTSIPRRLPGSYGITW